MGSPKPMATNPFAVLRLFVTLLYERHAEDNTLQLAAALAYNTLFSLLPTFVLVLLVVSILSSASNNLRTEVESFVFNQLGLNNITISTTPGSAPEDLSHFISDRLDEVRRLVKTPGTGIVAFATLLYGAVSLMLVIERAFNRIYRVRSGRPLARRISLYWCVLTLGPLGVGASIALSHAFHADAQSLVPAKQWLLGPLALVSSFLISWTLVFLFYKLIPDTRVHWRSALLGSFCGALLWESGKGAFNIYVHNFIGYAKFYGNLALVPLFMFWIYCTWNFILLGLQIAYIHQFYHLLTRNRRLGLSTRTPLADVRWVLPLAVLLYRRFRQSKPTSAEDAAEAVGLPPDVAEHLLKALQREHLVHAVETPATAPHGYALARPPEEITAQDLLAAARTLCPTLPGEGQQMALEPVPDLRRLPALAGV